jgi:hypothetical protein
MSKRPGQRSIYRMSFDQPKASRAKMQSLGIQSSEQSMVKPIYTAREMLGRALECPSNDLVLSAPTFFEDLPEHALKLQELADHLFPGLKPSDDNALVYANGGNLISKDKYRLIMPMGQKFRFRHSPRGKTLYCMTVDANYKDQWRIADDGSSKSMITSVSRCQLNNSSFLMSYIDRERYITQYRKKFENRDIKFISAALFSISVAGYEADERMRFNEWVGLMDKRVNWPDQSAHAPDG